MKQYYRFQKVVPAAVLGTLLLAFSSGLQAADVPILRKNMWELGGFAGASYGVDKSRVMGGGNLTYSVLRNILPYVEVSYFPGIERTITQPVATLHYSIPLTDVNFGIHARFQLPKTRIVPYAVLGFGLLHAPESTQTQTRSNDAGGTTTVTTPVTASTDFATNFGAGLRYYAKEQFGFRGEFKTYQLTGGPLKNTLGYDRIWRVAFGMFWQFGK